MTYLELIRKWCNNEDCNEDCSDCPYIEYFEYLEEESKKE